MFTAFFIIGFSLGAGKDDKRRDWQVMLCILFCLTITLDLIVMSKVNNKTKEINPQYPPDNLPNTELIKFRHSVNPTYDN